MQQPIEEIPGIGECDKVTDGDCFTARLYVYSTGQLDKILDCVAYHAETNTTIVRAQPMKRRAPPFTPAD